ncbi:MAG: hypothetical protein KDC35_11840 [Acidobacteria bacterium]|nr:hypothetical protein [Acidobacteriota bacterium]
MHVMFRHTSFFLISLFCLGQVDYDIAYIRAPRYGDFQNTIWPEVFHPGSIEPGTDMMLLHPDGSEELLMAGGFGAVTDIAVSFDGQTLFYVKFPDMRPSALNGQRNDLPVLGADIYKMDLATRVETRLTFQEYTPNTAAGNWTADPVGTGANPDQNYLGYGMLNLGPCPLPGGRIMFTSNRNGFLPNKSFTQTCMQLFVMDEDGRNVRQVGHLNLGSALHPVMLMDGRVMFSSYEAQGLRDRRLWGLWSMWPDGRNWGPLMSGLSAPQAFHFQTQLSNGDIAVVDYYNLNNNGFGSLIAFPANSGVQPGFGSPTASDPSNPPIQAGIYSNGNPRYRRYPFSPAGLYTLTPFTTGDDEAAPLSDFTDPNSPRVGKVTHPSAAPMDALLIAWTVGPANDLNRPTPIPYYDSGLYLMPNNLPALAPDDLVLLKNDPNYNEQWPKALVPYRDIYGIDAPAKLPFLPNDGSVRPELPAGTPFGVVGTASLINRNTKPGRGDSNFAGLDPFNTSENEASTNWESQGADAGLYTEDDIYAIRVLAMEPTSHRSYGPNGGCCGAEYNFFNHANERLRILGEMPVRNTDMMGNSLIDGDGNPDTSFLVKIPADVPFTFQTLDRNRMVLNMSQTWHQLRPGEFRYDCGGCHAHAEMPTDFFQTAASSPAYVATDMAYQTPIISHDAMGDPIQVNLPERAIDVEYHRDVKPILERSCVPCHNAGMPTAELVLDDESIVDRHENTFNRLARDEDAQYGYPPVITNGTWRQTNASRYIRPFQARRSMLIWKIFGERLDGWTNADHPTEAVPGVAATLPMGANPNDADLDYVGDPMPPPGSLHPVTGDPIPGLTADEKLMIATWVDLGCPVNVTAAAGEQRTEFGWFLDDLRPTLTVSSPRAGPQFQPLTELVLGAFDYYSGLDPASLSVTADFDVNGIAAGGELAGSFVMSGDHIWTLTLAAPIGFLPSGTLQVSVADVAGNLIECEVSFSIYEHALQSFPLDLWRNPPAYDQSYDLNQNGTIEAMDLVLHINVSSN